MFILENSDIRVDIPAPEFAAGALRQLIADTLGNDPGDLLADADWHKFKTGTDIEKGRTGCGSYRLDPAGPVAVFGSHRPGEADYRVVYFDFPGKDSEAWKVQAEAIRKATAEHLAAVRNEAAAQALATYQAGAALTGEHTYLSARGVAAAALTFGKLRTDAAGALLVPMADAAGTLRNLQTITPDGAKRYQTGGETAGLFLAIPQRPQAGEGYYLAEGLAKALAVWTATGKPTVCGFSAGNLAKVAAALDAGRAIVAADGDTAGREAGEACKALGCRVIYPPSGAGDWNDILARDGLDTLRQLLTTAPAAGPEPLYRKPDPPRPFPVDALGDLAGVVRLVSEHLNIDPALCGSSALAAVNLATCGLADVAFKSDFVRPSSLFMVTLAESGSGKSPADNLFLRPHRDAEREWEDAYALDFQLAADLQEAHGDKRTQLKKESKDLPPADRAQLLAELGPPPALPAGPHLIVSDSTIEGLARTFETNRPVLGSFSDEGGRLLAGWSLSREHAPRTLSGLTDLWENKPVKIIRASSEKGTVVLRGKRLALHWSMQPYVGEPLFADRLYSEQGFLPRTLITRPALLPPRPLSDHDLGADPAILSYCGRIRTLLARPLATREGFPLELAPERLTLAPDARRHFVAAWNHINAATAENGDLAPIRGFAKKLPDNILRLSATLALFHDPDTREIPLVWIESACTLATFYAAEMMRIHAGAAVDVQLREAEKLLEWITRTGRTLIYPRLIYRHGPASIRDKRTAGKVITTLVEHGYLMQAPAAEVDGAFRRDVFQLVAGGPDYV
jgi:hypothetical protein